MKTILLILSILVTTVTAFSQTKKPIVQTKMTDMELRSAASTNFDARCAIDFNWKDVTNKIAKVKISLIKANEDLSYATEKASLAHKAGQSNTTRTPAMVTASQQIASARKTMAALELQKLQIEEGFRKLMSAKVK